MEAAAISVAKSSLNSVVKLASTIISDEIGLLLGVRQELFFIKEELEMMQSFLEAASAENVRGKTVITWVKQVQELAYDVEDCLKEASVRLMKNNCLTAWCSVEKRDSIARKIRVLKARIEDVSTRNSRYSLVNSSSLENNNPVCHQVTPTRLTANDEALLVGLEGPSDALVKLIRKDPGRVISVVGMGGLGKTTLVRKVCQDLSSEIKVAWVNVLHPFNKEEFIKSLAQEILKDTRHDGKEGPTIEGYKKKTEELGKTNNMEMRVTEYLKDKEYIIVLDDLSSTFEWDEIKKVLRKSTSGSRIIVTTRSESLAEKISHSRDDIYKIHPLSKDDAKDLFFKAVSKTSNYCLDPSHENKSNPKNDLSSSCEIIEKKDDNDGDTKKDPHHESKSNLKNAPNSSEITEKKDENDEDTTKDPPYESKSNTKKELIEFHITEDMETQASLILEKCDRLPIAIITIGSYLATKPKTSAEWKTLCDHLSSELERNPDFGNVKTVISSSYDGMPYHLKSCFLYLSVFHNHQEIRRRRIIRRWIADGYVMGDRNKTVEEVGKGYFDDLMGRSLIQPSQTAIVVNGHVSRCNIHDLMYESILEKSMDEKVVVLLENENLISTTDKVRHLVITSGQCEGEIDLAKLNLSHMRSLSIFGKVGSSIKNPRMKLLRVLDLEGTIDLDNRHLKRVGKLRHLKYLGLRGTKITKLPKSLRKLHDLETLDIRNTAVLELPQGVTELRKLGYLRSGFERENNDELWWSLPGNCCFYPLRGSKLEAISNAMPGTYNNIKYKYPALYGVWVPRGIRKLKSLTTLGTLNVCGRNGLVKELQHLINLRKLALTGFSKKNGKTLAKVIDRLKHLRSLALDAEDEDDENEGLFCCLQNVSSPPKYLQSLKLYGRIEELPDWIKKLENLVKMKLRRTFLRMEEIKKIKILPNLNILRLLWVSFDGEELCFGQASFPKLQTMIIEDLTRVSFEENMLMSLENLEINCCHGLDLSELSGLHFLVRLKNILVKYHYFEDPFFIRHNENNQALVSKLKDEISRHPNKPNLIINIIPWS